MALERGGRVAADPVGVAAARTIEHVVAPAGKDRVRTRTAMDGVVAVAAVDHHVAAGDRDVAEVQRRAAAFAIQPHRAGHPGGIDLLDAAAGAEAAQETHVHIPRAQCHDPVDAAGAGVGVGVEAVEAAPAAGLVAGDAVGVATGTAVQHVVAAGAHDGVCRSTAVDRVVAVVAVDDEVAARQRRRAQVDQVRIPGVEQAHHAGRASRIDLLDAGRAPALDADVHRARADHDDPVDTTGAGVRIGVVAAESAGGIACDTVGVAAQAAIQTVVPTFADQQVVTRTTVQRVVTVTAPQRVICVAGVDQVVLTVAEYLVGTGRATECFRSGSA